MTPNICILHIHTCQLHPFGAEDKDYLAGVRRVCRKAAVSLGWTLRLMCHSWTCGRQIGTTSVTLWRTRDVHRNLNVSTQTRPPPQQPHPRAFDSKAKTFTLEDDRPEVPAENAAFPRMS